LGGREIGNATEERFVTRKEAKLETWRWNMPLDLADTLRVECEVCEAKPESNKLSLCSSLWRKLYIYIV